MHPLNQQLQNQLFREFEPQEYYQRHFKQGRRPDGRALQQARKVFATLGSFSDCAGSCLLRKGGCIIIVQVRATPMQLSKSPITNSYTTPLIDVQASFSQRKHTSYTDRNRLESYLSHSVSTALERLIVESELVRQQGYKQYGYALNIALKVLSEDGALFENCLLCTQFAICSTKLPDFKVEDGKIILQATKHLLKPTGFLYPVTYVELYQQLLLDPTAEEEQRSSYTVSILWNLLTPTEYTLTKRGFAALQKQIIEKLVDLSKVQISKQKFSLPQLQKRLQNITEQFTLELE